MADVLTETQHAAINYFKEDCGGLQQWASLVSVPNLHGRVILVALPNNDETALKVESSWWENFPNIIRTASFHEMNRSVYDKFHQDLADYGYPREALKELNVGFLELRETRQLAFRVEDVLHVLENIHLSGNERHNNTRINRDRERHLMRNEIEKMLDGDETEGLAKSLRKTRQEQVRQERSAQKIEIDP